MNTLKPIHEHSSYEFFSEILRVANPTYKIPGPERDKLIQKMIESFDPLAHIMDTEEAAQKWNMSRRMVAMLCKNGTIPYKMIGNSMAIDRNQEYVRERTPRNLNLNEESEPHEKN